MSEEILEIHMHKLREIGESHAKAKQNLERLQHGRKILLAVLMKEKMINSNTGKMDSADERYKKHIEELSVAVGEESKWHWEKKMIEINFETWKTKMINQIREAKAYGLQKN